MRREVQGRLVGIAGGRKPFPISWTQWWQLQLGALCPVQLLGKAWNEPLAPVQAENPHWDLDPALPLTSAGKFASLKLWKHLGTCIALRHVFFFMCFFVVSSAGSCK